VLDTRREQHLVERYQRLIELSQDLVSTLDLDVLLRHIVRAAADLIEAEQASILLYDHVKGELYFEATTNLDQPMMQGLSVPVEGSIAGWIVTNRQPLIISDANKDNRYFNHVAKVTQTKTTSLLGVPLINKDKVVGALEAINKQGGDFNAEDQQVLVTLGAQAALAIENARLFQQSDLIAELVHELRTPLASLNTATHLLLRPELPEEQRTHVAELIRDEIFRLSDLATSFLDLARLESGRAQFQMSSFNPSKLIEECTELMQARVTEAGLKLIVDLPDSLSPIEADEDKIKQVLINLISNAVKYNRQEGTITLSARSEPQGLVITVSDTGHGIPADNLPNLFQRFYRVPGTEKIAPGMGLGLSICKRIIEAHQGTIEVESEVDRGTTFIIHIPVK
jgi:signal transduction histidine kinase